MRIWPDHDNLQYTGRIDWEDRRAPVFVFPCTSVALRFTGNVLKVYGRNRNSYWDNYLGCILDGVQSSLLLPREGEVRLEIPVAPSVTGEHEILLFKRQDSCHEFTFLGVELEDGAQVLVPEKLPERRIEVYGDSVSVGEVSEAVAYTGRTDPEHNGEYTNSWYSYAWLTARRLHAQIHDIAQGGIALMDRTGWFCEPEAFGMETVWDKVRYSPAFGKMVGWDFSHYTPQAVIVAVGQNDSHPEDYMKDDYTGPKAMRWRERYRAFLGALREKYPQARIVCITTLLGHDPSWDRAIGEVVRDAQDERITQYLFRRNGTGTPGHLRIPEAEEMAEELADYLEGLHIDGWGEAAPQ